MRITCFLLVAVFAIALSSSIPLYAGDNFAEAASDSIAPFLLIGELTLALDHEKGKAEAVQGAKTLAVTCAATQLLKLTVRERRPGSDSRTSFPSGHTSAAFAMATVLGDYKPKCKLLAYGVAATIGWSRVKVDAHHWWDVVAGAGLGYAIGKHYTGQTIMAGPDGVSVNWKF